MKSINNSLIDREIWGKIKRSIFYGTNFQFATGFVTGKRTFNDN